MEFLQAAFGGTRDDPAALLRGVYFTSGTQEGTPIDRLTGTLARALGVDQTRAPTLQPVQGRSYFLERLLKEVIFGEALLVAHGPAAARRRLVLRTAGYAVPAVLVVATAAVLWQVHRAGQREIDAAAAALAGYEQTARGLPLDPVADDDLARLAPLLDQARALPRGGGEPSMAAGRTVAAREARCLGACRLSPRAGVGAAAAADVAAGDPVARQPQPPRLPLRGDARLSDARQCRPARRLAGARMDEAGLAGGVSRSRLCAAARGAAAAPGRAAGRAAAAGAARRRTGHRGARPDRHGAVGAARLFAHPPVRGGAAPAGVAARATRWVRRAWRCSCGRRASR